MASNSERLLSTAENSVAVAALREELARRRMSRQHLADEAQISISTLEKALSGQRPFTHTTVVRLETALGIVLRAVVPSKDKAVASGDRHAPLHLGAYTRAAVRGLEGTYLTLRPSFSDASAIYAYRTDIRWDEKSCCLIFSEADRADADFAQSGQVSVPHQSGHVYLVTQDHGQYRLITLSRPAIDKAMYGIISTLQVGAGSQLTPVAMPVALVPVTTGQVLVCGKIAKGHTQFAAYRKILDRVIDGGFARVLGAGKA